MTDQLHIAFVWHMHQPYYRASRTGPFELPWVRMHALKDYLDMVETLSLFPQVHQTFNLVPSLVEQLEDYRDPAVRDVYWEHTQIPADDLTTDQRTFIVDQMCEKSGHPRAMRHPRYLELARKRDERAHLGIEASAAGFSVQELRDLQIWFNLAWFDPAYQEREPLAGLIARGRDFSEDDKRSLATVQRDILDRVIPAYRDAAARGQVELTTSPYYHPILPLLVNTDSARIAQADIPLPPRRYAHPEDAVEQLAAGLAYHREVFGETPRGFWCSEQAVGEDVIPLLSAAGLGWTASDEGVLARSLGVEVERDGAGLVRDPDLLYRPYSLEREGRRLAIVFRDRVLSDLLGFTYQSWAPADAAANLIWRLRQIRDSLSGSAEPHLVTIALDGENAWEYYEADGRDFLMRLYEGLAGDPSLRCVTVSEFLDQATELRELPWLHTGSWVFADLSTWIGDPAHGAAWDALHRARDVVAARRAPGAAQEVGGAAVRGGAEAGGVAAQVGVAADAEEAAVAEAWHHIQVAQGSDWFWWFGTHQESGMDHVWDARFRAHLREAYRLVGEVPPLELFSPLLDAMATGGTERHGESHPPTSPFTPRIDGRVWPPEEWGAGGLCRAPRTGTMHSGETRILDELQYGRDEENLYLLLVPGREGLFPGTTIAVYLGVPTDPGSTARVGHTRFESRDSSDTDVGLDLEWEIAFAVSGRGSVQTTIAAVTDGRWGESEPIGEAFLDVVLEASLPLDRTNLRDGTPREVVVAVARDGVLAELLPTRGTVVLYLSGAAG